jgi:hypothetical protein
MANCLDQTERRGLISASNRCGSYPGAVVFIFKSVIARRPQKMEIPMKNPPGIKSVIYIETIAKLFSCLLALAAMRPIAEAATITVTDTGDTIAVGAYGTDTINFNIAGTGVHTIAPSVALPTITDPVIIDGYTQPGSAVSQLS